MIGDTQLDLSINCPVEVVTSEDLLKGGAVEIDLCVLADHLPVESVDDLLDVGGDVAKLGLLVGELVTLDFEDVGVGRCLFHGSWVWLVVQDSGFGIRDSGLSAMWAGVQGGIDIL